MSSDQTWKLRATTRMAHFKPTPPPQPLREHFNVYSHHDSANLQMELDLVCSYKSQLPPSDYVSTITFLSILFKKKSCIYFSKELYKWLLSSIQHLTQLPMWWILLPKNYLKTTTTKNYYLHLDNKYLFPEHPIYCQAIFQVQDTELWGENGSPCSTY